MCGRFVSKAEKKKIEKEFNVRIGDGRLVVLRFNIAPTQMPASITLVSANRNFFYEKFFKAEAPLNSIEIIGCSCRIRHQFP